MRIGKSCTGDWMESDWRVVSSRIASEMITVRELGAKFLNSREKCNGPKG